MSIKFKVADGASTAKIEEIVNALEAKGVAARRLFPNQKRASLARIFAVDAKMEIDVPGLRKLLDKFGDDIQYVEGEAERRPM